MTFSFSLSESGSEYSGEAENDEEFDELDHREDGQFWSTSDEPVERAETPDYEPYYSDDERPTPLPVISLFAVGKLCRWSPHSSLFLSSLFVYLGDFVFLLILHRYGFDRERARQALEVSGGDFGATLEQLLQQVFSERYGQKAVLPDGLKAVPLDECLAQRQEEAMALAAIYGDRFNERIANAVWTVTLDISLFMRGTASLSGPTRSLGGREAADNRRVCQFYLKGKGCRYGDKCKFKHQTPARDRSGACSPDLNGPSQPGFSSYSPPEYELEIRFPKGNCYPFQAPLVAFSTTADAVGAAGRLCVTERLFAEALTAAKSSEPVVYTLVTLCEDEATISELLAAAHHKYSTPPPLLPTLALTKSKTVKSNASEDSRSSSSRSANQAASRKTTAPQNQRATDSESATLLFLVLPGI